MNRRKALAYITYSRHQYFSLVLPSVLAQVVSGTPLNYEYDIYVFQDGLWDGETEENKQGHAKIVRTLSGFANPMVVVRQPRNLGVALHFDFIEKLLFTEKKYDFVVFCEDDLILAPGYVDVVDRLGEKFADDSRVGMVSAHPANCRASQDEQRALDRCYSPMGHNWGFGLSRHFWEKRQPFVECYLELVKDVPYRSRPHDEISRWLTACGFKPDASSQDYVKLCATHALGACRLSTSANLALPIGRSGLHCTPEIFRRMGFDATVVFDGVIDSLPDLDDQQYSEIYASAHRQFAADTSAP